jgi:hypothetical protein
MNYVDTKTNSPMQLFPAVAFCIANISRIVNTEAPLPEIAAAVANGLLTSILAIFGLFSYSMTVYRDKFDDSDGASAYDPCTAPGADPWKRLPCGMAGEKLFMVQMVGLVCVGLSACVQLSLDLDAHFRLLLYCIRECRIYPLSSFSLRKLARLAR